MKFPLCCAIAVALASSLPSASAQEPAPTPKPTLFQRMLHPFGSGKKATPAPTPQATPAREKSSPSLMHRILHPFAKKDAAPDNSGERMQVHRMELTMQVEPAQIVLSEVRTIKVTLRLVNHGKVTQLQFPTGQRVEGMIRDHFGTVVARWSEDQSFDSNPSFLTINPDERAEYVMMLPTRDLQAGELYSVEGSFQSYPDLTIRKSIVPAK